MAVRVCVVLLIHWSKLQAESVSKKRSEFCLSIPHLASGSRVDLVWLHSSGFLLQLFTFPNSHFKWSIFHGRSPHHSFFWLESNTSQVIAFSGVMASHCCYFTICIKLVLMLLLPFVLSCSLCIECVDLYWNLWPYQIKSNQIKSVAIMHFSSLSLSIPVHFFNSIHHGSWVTDELKEIALTIIILIIIIIFNLFSIFPLLFCRSTTS